MPTKVRLERIKQKELCNEEIQKIQYALIDWEAFDYLVLKWCPFTTTRGKNPYTVSNAIIMFDTETTKLYENPVIKTTKGVKLAPVMNAVVAFTVSIRCTHHNIVTLYGHKPSELVTCMQRIRENISGNKLLMFAHNLAYDYTFLRQFFFRRWQNPVKLLATKPHYPIAVEFENGIVLRDSLCIAQRKLEVWADDFKVEHRKEVKKWDYNKRRTQTETYSQNELDYIEHDTLAGVECLDKLCESLGVENLEKIYTATGIPRRDIRKIGLANGGNYLFRKCVPSFETYNKLVQAYHGALTHADRSLVGYVINTDVFCKDFCSSYPYVMLSEKYPLTPFVKVCDAKPEEILALKDDFAFVFRFSADNIRLKDKYNPMPTLQKSKAVALGECIEDNGRLLQADHYEAYLTETDLEVIDSQYEADTMLCTEVEYSEKDYLPRWFTDYVYQLFYDKCTLKGTDYLHYMIQKGKLNSCYGMCAMRSIREEFVEDYATGLYSVREKTEAMLRNDYEKYRNSRKEVLLFQWGVWITVYAYRNLVLGLGQCIDFANGGLHIYSDTDSGYSNKWNEEKVQAYNKMCDEKMIANNYKPVVYNGKEFHLGYMEEDEHHYTQFITLGAKRYCGRSTEDGELHITVAGVPKKGAIELADDIHNFKKGMVFHGENTGKLTHFYVYNELTNIDGYEVADSVDLCPCDYLLDDIERVDEFLNYETMINLYSEENL